MGGTGGKSNLAIDLSTEAIFTAFLADRYFHFFGRLTFVSIPYIGFKLGDRSLSATPNLQQVI